MNEIRVDKKLPGVYVIINALNHKRYVGSSAISINSRWATHKYRLRKGTHGNPHLQTSWNKYGESAFAFIAVENTTPENALEAEKKWYDYFKEQGFDLYNLKPGGQNSQLGLKMSEKTKQILAKSNVGRIKSQEEIEKIRQAHIGKLAPWTRELFSKEYYFISPSGEQVRGKNILDLCRQYDLDGSAMAHVNRGTRPSYKGWTNPEARNTYLLAHPLKRQNNLTQVCPICENNFHISPSEVGRRIYCSRVCRAKADSEKYNGTGNPNYRHGRRVKIH